MNKNTFIIALALFLACGCMMECSRKAKDVAADDDDMPYLYENELFSVAVPPNWTCDTSGWKGLDSIQNVVDIYDPNGNVVWFHFVKSFLPIKWKNIDEAKELSKTTRLLSPDSLDLIQEIDSIEVGGYLSCILLYANYVGNDTIIQKQFVTYMPESHIVVFFNENFYPQDWERAQMLGDAVISTIELKSVVNPLDNDSVLYDAIDKGFPD